VLSLTEAGKQHVGQLVVSEVSPSHSSVHCRSVVWRCAAMYFVESNGLCICCVAAQCQVHMFDMDHNK
jgi:hypothetical protein